MSLSRRALFTGSTRSRSEALATTRARPAGAGVWIGARGREEAVAVSWPHVLEAGFVQPAAEGEIRISSNENPLGPGRAAVDAIDEQLGQAGLYPTNAEPSMGDLRDRIAELNDVDPGNVVLGAGSGEILKNCVQAFTSESRHLVSATPTYESPRRFAAYLGARVEAPRVSSDGRLDLEAMAAAAPSSGLVFVCNPNNPTSTIHNAEAISAFVARVHEASPEAVILIDEAYHEYVTDPDHTSAIGLAIETPNVVVSRTFSKAFGMAGLRVGYAFGHVDTIRELRRYSLLFNTNGMGVAAAMAVVGDEVRMERQRQRNTEAKRHTVEFFERAGMQVSDSQTNFIFVDIGRSAAEFRDGCAEHNVLVGRDFPPFEASHARISIGTLEEMNRATDVFASVLGVEHARVAAG